MNFLEEAVEIVIPKFHIGFDVEELNAQYMVDLSYQYNFITTVIISDERLESTMRKYSQEKVLSSDFMISVLLRVKNAFRFSTNETNMKRSCSTTIYKRIKLPIR